MHIEHEQGVRYIHDMTLIDMSIEKFSAMHLGRVVLRYMKRIVTKARATCLQLL
jgi:hypothetical protein